MKKRFIGLILIVSLFILAVSVLATHTPTHKTGANATNTTKCGDGKVNQVSEQCDGRDLGGKSCISFGFNSGTLKCNSKNCTFDTRNCKIAPTTGNLRVTSAPSKADLYVDDIFRNQTPATVTELKVGLHSFTLQKEGYIKYGNTTNITAGKTTKVHVNLVKINQTGGDGGAGLSAPTTKCKESDKGANYFVNGTTCLTGNISVCDSDYCLSNSTLLEYYCKGKEISKKEYKCPKACKENACVR